MFGGSKSWLAKAHCFVCGGSFDGSLASSFSMEASVAEACFGASFLEA